MENENLQSNEITNYEIFCLILWTSWQSTKHKICQLFCVILCPSLFCVGLIITQSASDTQSNTIFKYEPIDLAIAWKAFIQNMKTRENHVNFDMSHSYSIPYSPFIPRIELGYAPNTYNAFQNIMQLAAEEYLNNIKYTGFTTCDQLRSEMNKKFYIAGICFDDSTMNLETESIFMVRGYSTYLSYTIIYPRELRLYEDTYIGNVWGTENVFETYNMDDQRNILQNDGGYVGYIREGFTSIQNAISMAYIQLVKNNDTTLDINETVLATENRNKLPNIFLQRYPYYKSQYTTVSARLYRQLPNIIMCGYLCSSIIWTKRLYDLKIKFIALRMHTLGEKKHLQLLAWLAEGCILLIIASLLQIIVLKTEWYNNNIAWPKAPISALLLLQTAYSLSALCFCFMISAFFSNSSLGLVVTSLCFILNILPSVWIVKGDATFGFKWEHVYSYLFFNSVMSFAYSSVLEFEELNSGFLWVHYVNSYVSERIPIVYFVIILFLLSLLYVTIGLYINYLREELLVGECIEKFMVFMGLLQHPRMDDDTNRGSIRRFAYISKVFQIKSVLENASIQINNLTKIYDGIEVVYDISTNIYENEITILLGHNGAGKTTLMCMIAGLIKPNEGTVFYYNLRVEEYVKKSARSLSYIITDDTLFDDLTPQQQLYLFCAMKGVAKPDIEDECYKYIKDMQMKEWLNYRTIELPYGVRKQLAICCALIGNSKIVLMDEPTSGIDIHLRQLIWRLLAKEKHGRTILMTTHSKTEVDAVGDRVLVMCRGHLNCDGSSFFLKHIYGSPLRLVCAKRKNCIAENVTRLIAEFIPDIALDCEMGCELYYIIDNKYLGVIEKLLVKLEKHYDMLLLEKCFIQECDIDDIFYKMGAQHPSHGNRQRHREILKGITLYTEEYDKLTFAEEFQEPTEGQRFCIILKAMLNKHYIYIASNKFLAFVTLFLTPSILVCVIQKGGITTKSIQQSTSLTFNLLDYNQTITVMERFNNLSTITDNIANQYKEMLSILGSDNQIFILHGDSFEDYIIEKQTFVKDRVNSLYLIGVTVKSNTIIGWFNNNPLHTAPLALNTIHRAMARSLFNKYARISVTIENLPYSAKRPAILTPNTSSKFTYFFYFYSYAMCLILPISVMDLIKEHQTEFKLQQFISGARLLPYWLSLYLTDIIKVLIITCVFIITILIYALILARDLTGISFTAKILASILYATSCILPFNYMLSLYFTDPQIGYIAISNIGLLFTSIFFVFDNSFATGYNNFIDCVFIYNVVPYFSLISLVLKVMRISYTTRMCFLENIWKESIDVDDCKSIPNCCKNNNLLQWHDGIAEELVALFAIFVLCWPTIWFIETRMTRKRTNLLMSIPKEDLDGARDEHKRSHSSQNELPFAIINERARVISLKPNELKSIPIVCTNIYSRHFDKTILERTNLVLNKPEVFAVMGTNGGGMTALLKIIIGALKLTYGQIHIYGLPLNEDLYKIYTHIGYCPQFCELPENFLVEEVMEYLSILRGIPPTKISAVCKSYAKVLGFYEYYHKPVYKCSCGILRRLGCAIAMLGNQTVIVMDQPERNIDIAGKRELWNIMQILKNRNRTFMLTSLSSQTSQIICDRIAIMKNRRFAILGHPYEVDAKYFKKGYLLRIKLKRIVQRNANDLYDIVESFIKTQFPSSTLKSRMGYILIFLIPVGPKNIGYIYRIMQMNTFILHIEDFILSRTHISTTFIQIADGMKL